MRRREATFLPWWTRPSRRSPTSGRTSSTRPRSSGGNDWYKILNPEAYFAAVVSNLHARGVCAFYDGEELAVKNENGFSDQYDILAGEWPGFTRRGDRLLPHDLLSGGFLTAAGGGVARGRCPFSVRRWGGRQGARRAGMPSACR